MDTEDVKTKIQHIFERLDALLALSRLPAKVDRSQLRELRTNLKSLESSIDTRQRCSVSQMRYINSIGRSVSSGWEAVEAAKKPKHEAK